MLTRHALTRRADTDGADAAVVERDYVLAHVVAQLHHARPEAGGRLVFKGGTALRFIYLPDYRYSADLDFTVLGGSAQASAVALGKVLEAARDHVAIPHLELTEGDKPAIAYIGPLGTARPRQIKVDLATDKHDTAATARWLRPDPRRAPYGSDGPRRRDRPRCRPFHPLQGAGRTRGRRPVVVRRARGAASVLARNAHPH